jgi:hypothetical protein
MTCETLINKYEVLHERELGIKCNSFLPRRYGDISPVQNKLVQHKAG